MIDRGLLALSKLAVAVVDDDPAVCGSLKFSLEVEGFSVRLYSSANEVLDDVGLSDCDCLVVDYNMPLMNGLDLIARLRERQVTAPVILMTGGSDRAVRARAADAGIPVVEKPFLGNTLIDAIQGALNGPRHRR